MGAIFFAFTAVLATLIRILKAPSLLLGEVSFGYLAYYGVSGRHSSTLRIHSLATDILHEAEDRFERTDCAQFHKGCNKVERASGGRCIRLRCEVCGRAISQHMQRSANDLVRTPEMRSGEFLRILRELLHFLFR